MFVDYNSYTPSASAPTNVYPYLLNQTYPTSGDNDFTTTDRLATEFYHLYGTDMCFLPREVNKEETTFGEYLSATINKGIPVRMFIEEVEAWSGNGDMYSKFGLQVTDECTCYINKTSFHKQTNNTYPKQGDLVYVTKSQKLFQISHIEDEVQPAFYLLGQRAGYKIQCKLFAYNHEVISQAVSAGIPSAIMALDNLLMDINNVQATLPVKDYNQNNAPIITNANPLIDTSESDPLME